jgi:hypothetical protein
MAKKVTRRPRRGKPTPVSRERRRTQVRTVLAEVRRAIATVVQQAINAALDAEVTTLLGRPKYARRHTAVPQRTGARCTGCQQDWAPRFWRDGHYVRTLLTTHAAVTIAMPRLRCICGGSVPVTFATVGRYVRCWGDVPERVRELAGLCLSLRDIREVLAWDSGQWLACSTLNRWVQEAAALAAALRGEPFGRVPAVVLLDGVWVTLLLPTGEVYRDRQGRERERHRRRKVPLLVAYGCDPQTGERWLLDWEQGVQEDEASWRGLLERLQRRGLSAAAGFLLFVHDGSSGLEAAFGQVDFGPGVRRQRCIFHVLRTMGQALQGERGRTREQRHARRRALLQEAAALWEPLDRDTVRQRYRAFCTRWRVREPKAVAALARAWEGTLAYLAVRAWAREVGQAWDVRYLRTTSALERVNRALRQKARQVGAFHAERGLTAALVLVAVHRGLTQPEPPTDLWTEVLEAGLVAA